MKRRCLSSRRRRGRTTALRFRRAPTRARMSCNIRNRCAKGALPPPPTPTADEPDAAARRFVYYLQLGAFRERAAAEELRGQIAFGGFQAEIPRSVARFGRKLFRIWLGPLRKRTRCRRAARAFGARRPPSVAFATRRRRQLTDGNRLESRPQSKIKNDRRSKMKRSKQTTNHSRRGFLARAVSLAGLAGLAAIPGAASAQESFSPVAGRDYILIDPPQPTRVGAGKIEVLEFFNYSCPHCFRFQGPFARWRDSRGGGSRNRAAARSFFRARAGFTRACITRSNRSGAARNWGTKSTRRYTANGGFLTAKAASWIF